MEFKKFKQLFDYETIQKSKADLFVRLSENYHTFIQVSSNCSLMLQLRSARVTAH